MGTDRWRDGAYGVGMWLSCGAKYSCEGSSSTLLVALSYGLTVVIKGDKMRKSVVVSINTHRSTQSSSWGGVAAVALMV